MYLFIYILYIRGSADKGQPGESLALCSLHILEHAHPIETLDLGFVLFCISRHMGMYVSWNFYPSRSFGQTFPLLWLLKLDLQGPCFSRLREWTLQGLVNSPSAYRGRLIWYLLPLTASPLKQPRQKPGTCSAHLSPNPSVCLGGLMGAKLGIHVPCVRIPAAACWDKCFSIFHWPLWGGFHGSPSASRWGSEGLNMAEWPHYTLEKKPHGGHVWAQVHVW